MFGSRPLHGWVEQTNLRRNDLVIRWAHVCLKIQCQRQNICECLRFGDRTPQVPMLDEKV